MLPFFTLVLSFLTYKVNGRALWSVAELYDLEIQLHGSLKVVRQVENAVEGIWYTWLPWEVY